MNHKKFLISFGVAVLLMLVSALVVTHFGGTPFKNIIVGILVPALYGLLILAWILRFVFVFLGVFAIYRILQLRYDKKEAIKVTR